ncbi:MAG: hypothetical protein FWG58_00705, partial [Methanomassiliicoccaceae archaeon]|nr:hypothetical protein [Methanomassiliicoccaceae archaeon]
MNTEGTWKETDLPRPILSERFDPDRTFLVLPLMQNVGVNCENVGVNGENVGVNGENVGVNGENVGVNGE